MSSISCPSSNLIVRGENGFIYWKLSAAYIDYSASITFFLISTCGLLIPIPLKASSELLCSLKRWRFCHILHTQVITLGIVADPLFVPNNRNVKEVLIKKTIKC